MSAQSDLPPTQGPTVSAESHPRWSVRALLIWLVVACLLPGIIGAAALFFYDYQQGRTQLEKDTLQTARALSQAVDNQILKVEALAHGLATASSLAQGDRAGFHRQARETLKRANLVASVVLIDRTGWQVVNTLKEFGEPLPYNGNPTLVGRVFESGQPVVSDLYLGAVMRRPIMTVAVPVVVDGQVAYVLIAPILPERFNAILSAQGLPQGWVASILDGTGTIVARNAQAPEFLGKKAAPEFRQRFLAATEGCMEGVAADGSAVFSVFARSPVTHWGVGIEIPRQVLEAPLVRSLSLLALGVALLFALGVGVGRFLGAKIAGSFRVLVAPALALGEGKAMPMPPVEVTEAAEVTRAMDEAGKLLQERENSLHAREAELGARTAALRQSESRLRILTDHAPAALALFDPDMRYLAASRRWLDDFRLGGREIIGKCHYDIFPNLPERWKEAHRRGLAGESLHAEADRFQLADGSMQWTRWGIWPWHDDSGAVGGIVIAAEDITERMEAIEALRRSRELLRLITDGVPALIAYLDTEYRYRLANRTYLRWFGLSPEKMIGLRVSEVVGQSAWKMVYPQLLRAMAGESVSYESEFPYPGGETRWMSVSYTPDRDENGEVRGISVLVHDITDRKRSEDEIHRLNAELEHRVEERTAELTAANRELEAFTFAASHDLRGPLGRINSFSTLLERASRDRLEGDSLLFLDLIRQNAIRLTQLVDDLLSHARIAQQSLELRPVDLRQAAENIIREKDQDIREFGTEILLDLPAVPVLADPHALGQALGNLLENALKYSSRVDSPRVEVGGEQVGDRFRLRVRDNGIGFKMEYHDKIFQIFQRLHTYTEYAGSGVGLALVKRAVERMGGKVWAESTPGQGATFYLELQVAE